MSGIGLGLHSKLGEKYKRVVSNKVCLGFTPLRISMNPSLEVKQFLS